jgi:diacylglycerol kinase family enzyme
MQLTWQTGQDKSAPPAAQIDGEEFPATEQVEIEVVPRAIRLVVPA